MSDPDKPSMDSLFIQVSVDVYSSFRKTDT